MVGHVILEDNAAVFTLLYHHVHNDVLGFYFIVNSVIPPIVIDSAILLVLTTHRGVLDATKHIGSYITLIRAKSIILEFSRCSGCIALLIPQAKQSSIESTCNALVLPLQYGIAVLPIQDSGLLFWAKWLCELDLRLTVILGVAVEMPVQRVAILAIEAIGLGVQVLEAKRIDQVQRCAEEDERCQDYGFEASLRLRHCNNSKYNAF